jgi:hypothetical protein
MHRPFERSGAASADLEALPGAFMTGSRLPCNRIAAAIFAPKHGPTLISRAFPIPLIQKGYQGRALLTRWCCKIEALMSLTDTLLRRLHQQGTQEALGG